MQKTIIVANWKMNPQTLEEAKDLFDFAEKEAQKNKDFEIIVCPPFPYISALKSSDAKMGAQDVFYEEKGAYTGEVSISMLRDVNCRYVIVGHSERRKHFGEIDETINRKIKVVIGAGLKTILCIGETQTERGENKINEVLKKQLENDLKDISDNSELIIAYEPIWAIGTGVACSIPEAKEAYLFIRTMIKSAPILYGGSVNSKNAAGYAKESGFQGLLLGGASLDKKELLNIIENIKQ